MEDCLDQLGSLSLGNGQPAEGPKGSRGANAPSGRSTEWRMQVGSGPSTSTPDPIRKRFLKSTVTERERMHVGA